MTTRSWTAGSSSCRSDLQWRHLIVYKIYETLFRWRRSSCTRSTMPTTLTTTSPWWSWPARSSWLTTWPRPAFHGRKTISWRHFPPERWATNRCGFSGILRQLLTPAGSLNLPGYHPPDEAFVKSIKERWCKSAYTSNRPGARQFCPQSSDDLCLLFCINPSSMVKSRIHTTTWRSEEDKFLGRCKVQYISVPCVNI